MKPKLDMVAELCLQKAKKDIDNFLDKNFLQKN